MENNNSYEIKELERIVKELLARMSVEADVTTQIDQMSDEDECMTIVHIQSQDAHMLIGQGGMNMSGLQHIVRMLYRKACENPIRFTIDVNNYREERRELLNQLALSSAHRAVTTGEDVVLRPMSSYERRLIHQILGKHDNVETESIGVPPGRRVVIRAKK